MPKFEAYQAARADWHAQLLIFARDIKGLVIHKASDLEAFPWSYGDRGRSLREPWEEPSPLRKSYLAFVEAADTWHREIGIIK